MRDSKRRAPLIVRRLGGALLLLAAVAAADWLLPRLGVSLTRSRVDPVTRGVAVQDWGLVAIGIAGANFAARLLDYVFFDLLYRIRRKAPVPALLRQLIGLFVFAIGVALVVRAVLSMNLAPLLTTSAVITAVIGLALQDTLGNLFAGLALHLEKTVEEGDLVRVGETFGAVEELSWRAMQLRTMEGNVLLIPNSVAGRERLEIYRQSGPPVARLMRVGLEYDASPARALEALAGALRATPGLAGSPEPVAYLKEFADSSIVYELRYWLEDYGRFLEIDSRVRERVWYALDRAGLTIAYPVIRQHQYAAGPLPRPAPFDGRSHLSAVDLFAPLSDEHRARLADGALQRRYARGETVVREGEEGRSMFLVKSGRLAVSIEGVGGTSQSITVLEAGSAFGEISLLTGVPRTATVRAITEATLVEIDKGTLSPILKENPSLASAFEATMRERRQGVAEARDASREAARAEEPVPLAERIARFFGLD